MLLLGVDISQSDPEFDPGGVGGNLFKRAANVKLRVPLELPLSPLVFSLLMVVPLLLISGPSRPVELPVRVPRVPLLLELLLEPVELEEVTEGRRLLPETTKLCPIGSPFI